MRQWHLDLAEFGTAATAFKVAVPNATELVPRSLVAGTWSNAMTFSPLAFRPQLVETGLPGGDSGFVCLDLARVRRDGGHCAATPARSA